MIVDIPEENEHFSDIKLADFHRDTEDWVNPDTGEVTAATFRYYANLTGVRKRDGTSFYSMILLPSDFADHPLEAATKLLEFYLASALAHLETFAHCACQAGAPCPRH